jgi:hypothetical protein
MRRWALPVFVCTLLVCATLFALRATPTAMGDAVASNCEASAAASAKIAHDRARALEIAHDPHAAIVERTADQWDAAGKACARQAAARASIDGARIAATSASQSASAAAAQLAELASARAQLRDQLATLQSAIHDRAMGISSASTTKSIARGTP